MTNIEVAKIMVSGMKCLLSREQIHELADILICRKFKKGERILMKAMFVVPCSIWKRD